MVHLTAFWTVGVLCASFDALRLSERYERQTPAQDQIVNEPAQDHVAERAWDRMREKWRACQGGECVFDHERAVKETLREIKRAREPTIIISLTTAADEDNTLSNKLREQKKRLLEGGEAMVQEGRGFFWNCCPRKFQGSKSQ